MKAKRLEESSLALNCDRMLQPPPPLLGPQQQQQPQPQQQEKDFIASAPDEDSSSSLTTTTMQVDEELLKVASTDEQQRSGKIRASGAESSPCCSPRSHLKMKRVSSTRVVKAPQDRRTPAYARSPLTPPKKSLATRRLFGAPSAEELEEFFAASEDKMELRSFMDRYNFDVVHDVPLPGRYEWVKVQE